jgi:hypothetical protein
MTASTAVQMRRLSHCRSAKHNRHNNTWLSNGRSSFQWSNEPIRNNLFLYGETRQSYSLHWHRTTEEKKTRMGPGTVIPLFMRCNLRMCDPLYLFISAELNHCNIFFTSKGHLIEIYGQFLRTLAKLPFINC